MRKTMKQKLVDKLLLDFILWTGMGGRMFGECDESEIILLVVTGIERHL